MILFVVYCFLDCYFYSYVNYLDYKYNDSDVQDEKQMISLFVG